VGLGYFYTEHLNVAKTMRQYLLLLLFTLPINLHASECQTIRANGSSGWEPISYRGADRQLSGMAVEVANQVFSQLAVTLKFEKETPWKRQLLQLEKGELDLVIAAYFNDERAKIFGYSQPYYIDKIRIFVLQDRTFDFQDLQSLKGKAGLRPLGGTYGNQFDAFAKDNPNIKEYFDYENGMKRLYKGRVDYMVLALFDGLFNTKKYAYPHKVIPLPKDVAQLPIHFLMSKKSPCINLIERINYALAELKSSNFTKKLKEKYMRQLE